MTKKSKKRQLTEVESAGNTQNFIKTDDENKNLPKKKKLKINSFDSTDGKKQNANDLNNGTVENISEKLKKKKLKLKSSKLIDEKKQEANVSNNAALENSSEKLKKKKLKIKSDKSTDEKKQEENVSKTVVSIDSAEKLKKKKKKKSKKNKQTEDNKTDTITEKPSETKVKKDKVAKVISSKRKELFKKKREEFKEHRKLTDEKKQSPFGSIEKMSLEEMKKKIAEIESRETMSKTAIRRLRILRKKLQVAEESVDDAKGQKRKTDSTDEKTENKNKKFKKDKETKTEVECNTDKKDKKMKDKKSKQEKATSKNIIGEQLFIEDRIGDTTVNDNTKNVYPDEIKKKAIEKINKIRKIVLKGPKREDEESVDSEDEKKTVREELDNIDKLIRPYALLGKSTSSSSEDDEEDDQKNNFEKVLEEDKNESDDTTPEDDDDQENDFKKVSEDENESEDTPAKVQIKKPKATIDSKTQKKNQVNENDKSVVRNQRYVLFVGNLAYQTTTVDLKKHFLTKVTKVKDVRIPLVPGGTASRGFGYVEFENSEDFEKGLSLHDSFVNGRKITVQYTTSGSKKVSNKQDIVHKNKKLHAMRKKGMLAGSKKDSHKRSFRRNKKNFKNEPKS